MSGIAIFVLAIFPAGAAGGAGATAVGFGAGVDWAWVGAKFQTQSEITVRSFARRLKDSILNVFLRVKSAGKTQFDRFARSGYSAFCKFET
jgi:hypothetical protein